MEMNKSPCRLLALAARSNRLPSLEPLVTNRIVLSKPASCSDWAITSASLRLNSYSGTPRALSAPGEVAVWPTSMSTRNADRAQLPLSLPCCVTGSSARASCPAVPVSTTVSATSRRQLPLLTIIDHNSAGAAASQPNRGFLESPHALCTCLLAVVHTQYDPIAP